MHGCCSHEHPAMPDTEKLKEIAKLKADGILNDEEFEVEKKKILMAGDA